MLSKLLAGSCGGNLLMNVGPTSQGTIDPIFQERLRSGQCSASEIIWSQGSESEIIKFESGSGSGSSPLHTKLEKI